MVPQEPSAGAAPLAPPPPPRVGMPIGAPGAPPPPPVVRVAASPAAPPVPLAAPAAPSAAPVAPVAAAPVAPPVSTMAKAPLPTADTPVREIPSVRPSAPLSIKSEKMRSGMPSGTGRVSRVPSVPVLFDNEPQNGDDDAPDAGDANYPTVMLEPLHVLDPLCLKWNLSKLSMPMAVPEDAMEKIQPAGSSPAAAQTPAPVSTPASSMPMQTVPSSAELSSGYLRLLGLLSNGSPWECSVPLTDMTRPGGVTIGRDPSCCDIVLNEPSISRRHAAFELTSNGVTVTDQNSTNGTYLNGRRFSPYDRAVPLQDGYILTLGEITLRVEIFAAINSYMA